MSQGQQYRSDSQQTLLAVLDVLGERPLEPLPLADLVDRIGAKRDQVFRAVKNLQIAGWVDQTPGGWRLTPLATRWSERVRVVIADLHRTYLALGEEGQRG